MLDNYQEAKEAFNDYDLTEALLNDDPNDIISEIADSNVDVYTGRLLEWVGQDDNYQAVEDAIDDFGFPETEGKPDMIKAIMLGQYKHNEDLLWKVWEDIKK